MAKACSMGIWILILEMDIDHKILIMHIDHKRPWDGICACIHATFRLHSVICLQYIKASLPC